MHNLYLCTCLHAQIQGYGIWCLSLVNLVFMRSSTFCCGRPTALIRFVDGPFDKPLPHLSQNVFRSLKKSPAYVPRSAPGLGVNQNRLPKTDGSSNEC